MPSFYKLEIPIFGPASGPAAAEAGAKQVELNRSGSYSAGGLTPTLSELETLISSLPCSVSKRPIIRVMIRPRGAPPQSLNSEKKEEEKLMDFIYSPEEYEEMKDSIRQFVGSGLLSPERGDGFVLGALKYRYSDGTAVPIPDVEKVRELVNEVGGLKVVFHRAFDELVTSDAGDKTAREGGLMMRGLKEVGVDGILTSGGRGRAVDNVGVLRRLLMESLESDGGGPDLIIGGGVRSSNLKEILEGIGGKDVVYGTRVLFHSSCLRVVENEEVFDMEEARELGRLLDVLGVETV
ncbi:copper homeostasis CutC domain-containing protein [Cladorrhinum sp. PSN259]|nr:copper homeostasis CutC domain-containing protein [Cladorrhinum sp. PSN259]